MRNVISSKTVKLLLLLAAQGLCQGTYQGLRRFVYIPVPSDVTLSSDLPCALQGQNLNSAYNRQVGDIPSLPLSAQRFSFRTPAALAVATLNQTPPYQVTIPGSPVPIGTCKEFPIATPMKYGGYHLVVLHPFPYRQQTRRNPGMFPAGILGSGARQEDFLFRIPDAQGPGVETTIRSQLDLRFGSYSLVPTNSARMPNSSGDPVSGATYLTELNTQLRAAGVTFLQTFLARTDDGQVVPVLLKRYGTQQWAYAVYGVWSDAGKAKQAGFRAGQLAFMTEREYLPDPNPQSPGAPDLVRWPELETIDMKPALRFGRETFALETILSDEDKYLPRLAWRTTPRWSDMPKTFNDRGDLQPLADGEYPPSAPDNEDNTNPISLRHCPDQDWYFDLFYQCLVREMATPEEEVNPKAFNDFRDYLSQKAMTNQYDATIYYNDKSISTQYITTENPPVEPALYNKDGKLLNRNHTTYVDPWDPATRMYLQYREGYWDWGIYNHRHSDRDLTTQSRAALNKCLDLYTTNLPQNLAAVLTSPGVTVEWADEGYKDSALYLGNPADNFNPHKTAQEFCVFDNNYMANGGNPFATRSVRHGEGWIDPYNQSDEKDWYIRWKWSLVYKDKNRRKYAVGTVHFQDFIYSEEDRLMASGQEEGGSKQNLYLTLSNPKATDSEFDKYDLKSKEYRTDQTDAHDRNNSIDKGEAVKTIVRKIAIAEGLNFITKALYANSDNQYLAAAYEANKRLENNATVKKTYNMAMKGYHAYVLWAQTMDILAEVRDTYQAIGPAWDGMLSAVHNIRQYYEDLDYSTIRLTNITKILPAHTVYSLDYNLFRLQSSLANFNLAVDALAFQTDRFTRGNYGPFNPLISMAYAELAQAAFQSGEAGSKATATTTANLDALTRRSGSSSSDAAYLSNITRASHNLLTNNRYRIMNERTRSAALALYLAESDSKAWITYSRHMRHTFDAAPAAGRAAEEERSFLPVVDHFRSPGLFSNETSRYILKVADE